MTTPVEYVVIHHSYIPGVCTQSDNCVAAMRWMQVLHQKVNGWNDVGYSFAVGGDGRAYEGRGWNWVGAHAPGYNTDSIGICVIGDWREALPGSGQMKAIGELIKRGVAEGWIVEKYKLIGHRQAKETDCPGDELFGVIEGWGHFEAHPNATGLFDNKLL